MEIIKEFTAEYNLYGDTEKIIIARYPNGKFYIHYGWMENHQRGSIISGGYENMEEAEKALKKHRPTATENKDKKAKNKIEQAKDNFLIVRDKLNADKSMSRAYRLAWKKPWKFYIEHTPTEAIEILKVEAEL